MLLLLLLSLPYINGQNLNGIEIGFPAAWDGDKYKNVYCPSHGIPQYLDGYFLCQLSAAYGNDKDPPGQKLSHMIDAIGALASFHISQGQVFFSAEYYPSRPYKIWDYYGRDFRQSKVPWAGWSAYNLTAMHMWSQMDSPEVAAFHPNIDFWKIGNRIVAGTETPLWVGLTFNVTNLNNFIKFPFIEDNDIFNNPDSPIVPLNMPIHERLDPDGTIWSSCPAMNMVDRKFHQIVFTVNPSGVRKVEGIYHYGKWDPKHCGSDDHYQADKSVFPGYMHSIAATEDYLILPITSLVINPCKFKPPPTDPTSDVQSGGMWGMDFYSDIPMRFLVFNKRTKTFVTPKPLQAYPAMWISHQFNAYEKSPGMLIADMIVYDSHDFYAKYLYTNFLKSQVYPSVARMLRFTLDLVNQRIMYNYLLPQETVSAEFSQFNHKFEGRKYKWGYAVQYPFAAGSSILKINVDDSTGANNIEFRPGPNVAVSEPWFVPRPLAIQEDDGVLLVRGLDVLRKKGYLYVVDAITMKERGKAEAPTPIPFGFHNRFYTKQDLGLPQSPYQPFPNSKKTTTTTFPPFPFTAPPSLPKTSIPFLPSKFTPPPPLPTQTTTEVITFPSKPIRPIFPIPVPLKPVQITTKTTPSTTTTSTTTEPTTKTTPSTSTDESQTTEPPPGARKTLETLYEKTVNTLCGWFPNIFNKLEDLCTAPGDETRTRPTAFRSPSRRDFRSN